jgi:hypothetical protein
VVVTALLRIEVFWDVILFRLASAYRMLSSSVSCSPTISVFVLTENPTARFLVRRLQIVTNVIVHRFVSVTNLMHSFFIH